MLITRQIFTTNYKYIGFTAVRPGVWTDADDASSMRHVCTTHVLNITELITETDNNYSPFVADSLPTDDYGIYRATYQHQCQWMYAVHELVTEHSLTSHCVGIVSFMRICYCCIFLTFQQSAHIAYFYAHKLLWSENGRRWASVGADKCSQHQLYLRISKVVSTV